MRKTIMLALLLRAVRRRRRNGLYSARATAMAQKILSTHPAFKDLERSG